MHPELMALIAGRRGHFQMESGYHSEMWFELGRLFDEPARLQPFVAALAQRLAAHRIDAVCGPMVGGAKLAAVLAHELGVTCFWTERLESSSASGLFPVRYQLPSGQRETVRGKVVAVVDDAISAGSAVRGTHADLLACGARPVALGALIVFGDAIDRFRVEHGLGLETIARMDFGMWKPDECPLCKAGQPFEKVSDNA